MAELAASLGWPVWANDALESAIVMTAARLASVADIRMAQLGGYAGAVERLDEPQAVRRPDVAIYSPAWALFDSDRIERRYFSERNAAAIDAVRAPDSRNGRRTAFWPTAKSSCSLRT